MPLAIHHDLRQVRFQNDRLSSLGIEPLKLSRIRAKMPSQQMHKAERVELYVLIFVTAGRGSHMVDFQRYPIAPGSLVIVRPGQVQQWSERDSYEADVLLFDPAALPGTEAWPPGRGHNSLSVLEWSAVVALGGARRALITEDIRRLQHDFDHYDGSELDNGLLRGHLLVLLMRLARFQHEKIPASKPLAGKRRNTFIAFIHQLESDYASQHSVQYYVNRLGYAESTLNRACRAECGYGAKTVIDKRIVLEAQRLLVHSESSVAEIAYLLGFTEATNFSKFFRRLTSMTPAAFRER
ncbi:MAG: helix-turn-helix transcriptional regulator [Pseudomonadota bacterium]